MDIKRIIPRVTRFEIVGANNIGAFHLQTKYSYRLTPPHPDYKCVFSVVTKNVFDALNGSGIFYNVEVHFSFDMENIRPTTNDLLNLAQKGRDIINEHLRELVLEKTDLNPIEISPINIEETLPIFEINISSAYQEN